MGEIVIVRALNGAEPERHKVRGRIIDWLESHFPRGFGCPVRAWLNGRPVRQDVFARKLGKRDELVIGLAPGTGAEIPAWAIYAIAAASAAVAIYTYSLIPDIPNPDGQRAGNVFSVSAQANQARLGEPVPLPYGDVTRTPDHASQSWRYFKDNREHRIYFLCLGCGDQAVREIRIGDTPVSSLPPGLVRSQVFRPSEHRSQEGRIAAAFGQPENVITSGDVARQELRPRLKFDGEAKISGGTDGAVLMLDDALADEVAIGDVMRFAQTGGGTGPGGVNLPSGPFGSFEADYTVTARDGDTVTIVPRPAASFNGDFRVVVFGFDSIKAGPFVATKPGVSAGRYQLDFEFPRGLHRARDDGDFAALTAVVRILAQAVNDEGVPVGDFITSDHEFRGATATPQRRTVELALPAGRYQFTCVRAEPSSHRYTARDADQCLWAGLKAIPEPAASDVATYGPVTILALEIIGAEALSASSQQRIFVRTVSILPPVRGGAPAESANPGDVVFDLLSNGEHGAGAPLLANIDSLADFAAALDGRPGFNGVFDQPVTVWDALTAVCRIGQGRPDHLPGGGIGVVRDMPRPLRRTAITLDTIAGAPPALEIRWPGPTDPDGIEVEYSDAANTAVPKYVKRPADCLRPRRVAFKGCTDDQLAADFAEFFRREEILRATRVSFSTELLGRHLALLDRVAVAVPDFNWGDGAVAEAFEQTGEGWRLDVSRPVPAGPLSVLLRHPDGEVSGLIPAGGDGDFSLLFDADPGVEIVLRGGVPTVVAWADPDAGLTEISVTAIEPSENTVSIEGALYDERLWEGLFT